MAGQRGILGVKKDPKKQILFSFKTREGEEWPSDDSDDSDYEPSTEEGKDADIKIPKEKKPRNSANRNIECGKSDVRIKGEQPSIIINTGQWTQRLPPELLLKIFQYITDEEGAIPFVNRLGKVCASWANLGKHPSLWRKVDLSYGWVKSNDSTLKNLCPKRLTRVQDLNLSSWKNLTDVGLNSVAENCPHLQSLNIAHCTKIKSQALLNIVKYCQHIAKLNISFLNLDPLFPQNMKVILQILGSNLTSLEMGGNTFKGFNGILNALMEHCPNLELLDVCNSLFSTDFMMLNIEKLQFSLTKLRTLRMANSKFRATAASSRVQAEALGFPQLEELSIAINPDAVNTGIGIDDNFISRLLRKSQKVRLLDLRGSSHLTNQALQALPVTDLEHLYLSQSSVGKYSGIEVIMSKWQHSMRELDLSWNRYPEDSLDLAMKALSRSPDTSQLEILNLSGTSISSSRVQSVLRGCPKLKTLNLTSCRGLARGMKRNYDNKDLDHLRQKIDSFVEDD